MSNKPVFDANMRFLRYSSAVIAKLDDLVYEHRAITGETPDDIRALIYIHCEKAVEALQPAPSLDEIVLYLLDRARHYQQKVATAQNAVETAAATATVETPIDAPDAPPTPVPEAAAPIVDDRDVWITAGGSHRRYKLDTRRLTDEGIAWRDTGPIAYRSKFRALAISARDLEKAQQLGFHKSKVQPRLWKGVD